MLDARITNLLSQKDVQCALRKQPAHITQWFYARLAIYNALFDRPDASSDVIRVILDELYTVLKFLAKPNCIWRKEGVMATNWPSIQEKLNQL